MASQRPYSDEVDLASDSHTQPRESRAVQLPPASRRRWRNGYWWVLLAVIAGFWYVGLGWGNSGGWIWGHEAAPAAGANDGELNGSGLVILEVANKQDYIGQTFQIRNVAVDHWSDERAVWIGSRHSYLPMLLVFPSASPLAPKSAVGSETASTDATVDSGPGAKVQHLNVTGNVMKAPPTAQAQQQWKLSDEDVDQLEEEGVYIQATSVQPAKN